MSLDICLPQRVFCQAKRRRSTGNGNGTCTFRYDQRVSDQLANLKEQFYYFFQTSSFDSASCSCFTPLKNRIDSISPSSYFSYAKSIYYTALQTSPSVLMTWTEQNVNNQKRCGIVKHTLKTPSLDNIEDIFDYSYLQHDITTLYAINGKDSLFHSENDTTCCGLLHCFVGSILC